LTAKDILKIAVGEIGTKEEPDKSNNVKYNTWYYGREVSGSDYAWCVVFIAWLFEKSGAPQLWIDGKSKSTASAGYVVTAAQKAGQWVTSDFAPGDCVAYDFTGKKTKATHMGIVEQVNSDGTTITAIEGNTSDSSDTNGGCVMRRVRDLKYVMGAFRPKYTVAAQTDPNTPSSWATDAWTWAKAAGITDGTNPKSEITREQVATMLYRYSKIG